MREEPTPIYTGHQGEGPLNSTVPPAVQAETIRDFLFFVESQTGAGGRGVAALQLGRQSCAEPSRARGSRDPSRIPERRCSEGLPARCRERQAERGLRRRP